MAQQLPFSFRKELPPMSPYDVPYSEEMGKYLRLSITEPEKLQRIAHALSSPIRIQVMRQLGEGSMNVGEIAAALDIPMSTAAISVKTLEDAGLIRTVNQPGVRGSMKLCSRRLDHIDLDIAPPEAEPASFIALSMPIGGYSRADGIQPTCGLCGLNSALGEMDNPLAFYQPNRFEAQLVWFRQGFLEYRLSLQQGRDLVPDWVEISFEACSEAPMYRDPWKSDIAVDVNGKRLGIWTCPCDCGGRHGVLTPAWWSDLSTQFGFLKTWRVDGEGTYLDGEKIGTLRIQDLDLFKKSYFSVSIGVPEDAENIGGINLFGEAFGDHPQALSVRVGYHF